MLGGEASLAREDRDELAAEWGDERAGVFRSSSRVWYAKILGDEDRPLGGEEAVVGVSGMVDLLLFRSNVITRSVLHLHVASNWSHEVVFIRSSMGSSLPDHGCIYMYRFSNRYMERHVHHSFVCRRA